MERLAFHDWKNAFNENFERVEKVKPLTKGQRDWILRAYNIVYHTPEGMNVCAFPVEKHEGFYLCGYNKDIQVHHIQPRGFASHVLGWSEEQINHPTNLIPLCLKHHVARGIPDLDYENELLMAIHPDIEYARRHYKGKQHPTSYDEVFELRKQKMLEGEPYWNTFWDIALKDKAEETYYRYLQWQMKEWGEYRDIYPTRKQK